MTRAAPVAGTRPSVRKGRIGTMKVAVDGEERPGSPRAGVSGTVVHALVSLIRSESGEAGVAQALALAAEERPFPVLGDAHSWTPLADATALFTAGALVTGDGAIALHTGHELLWIGGNGDLADRLVALGSPEAAVRHIGALIEQFEGATEAVALESGPGHALVQVASASGVRSAHLCELTRGLLSELPVPFDREPALVTEHECAARGGRYCRYALSWDVGAGDGDAHERHRDSDGRIVAEPGPTDTARRETTPRPASNGHAPNLELGDRHHDHDDDLSAPDATAGIGTTRAADSDELVVQLQVARTALVEASAEAARWEAVATNGADAADERLHQQVEAEAARTRTQIARLERLLEGASTPTLDLLEHDSGAVVAELGERADHVLEAERYVLMLRVGAGMPLELHHRGLTAAEAHRLTAELWTASPDHAGDGLQIVDIASPVRRYGRLAVLSDPGTADLGADEQVLRLFARYAANVLDVFTLLSDARRSDSTARTLLSFSEQLSGLTNLAQALQILADTVPAVTGCDQSTVYLWDRDRSRLVLGAYTSGMAAPDADLGPISPHWSAAASTTQIHVGRLPAGSESDTLAVEVDNPLIEQMISARSVMVLDASTVEDPQLRAIMEASGIPASVVAPLFAAGEFLGVIAANYSKDTARGVIRDPDLHERLSGLADQAATAIQNLELLEKVSHMAWHDALTGLPNRRLFEDRVEQELVRSRRVGEPVCMFFVDLDNFKTVNDTYGHATGDVLIQQVGQRLVETVRSQDTVCLLYTSDAADE